MRRVFANAAWAGLVTGLSLALMYVVIRLLFVFADTGQMPDGSVVSSGTTADGVPIACTPGPDCTFRRYFADPELEAAGLDLLSQGITDGDTFARAFVGQLVQGGAWIVILTVGGCARRGRHPVRPDGAPGGDRHGHHPAARGERAGLGRPDASPRQGRTTSGGPIRGVRISMSEPTSE